MDAICPYCNASLKKQPTRKTKCPSCKNYIFVKRSIDNPEPRLVTEDEKIRIEQEWSMHYYEKQQKQQIESLKGFGITDKEIDDIKDRLRIQFDGEPVYDQIRWEVLNHLVKTVKDYQTLKIIYWDMANYADEHHKDPFRYLLYSNKCDLYHLMEFGVCSKVEIRCSNSDDCPASKSVKNKVYSIEEALTLNILPLKSCTNFRNNDNYPFCTCSYSGIIE